MILLCTKSGEVIDQKEISMKYKQEDSTVIVETPAYSLLEIIKLGEGSHIEFKAKLDNPEPFVSSVVSFANYDGGRIFVGVDDYGEIVGVKKPEDVLSKISNWIAQYCDPRVEVNAYFSQELGIIVVEISVGDKRPYFLKAGGCYIRHGQQIDLLLE
ncbi:MAG: ATP-binding protein [Nitrosopumilaceae archaeon]|nr:ATP-binding protein [Nitrosopumilaceae archaeon]